MPLIVVGAVLAPGLVAAFGSPDIEALLAKHGRITERDLERIRISERPDDMEAGYVMWHRGR